MGSSAGCCCEEGLDIGRAGGGPAAAAAAGATAAGGGAAGAAGCCPAGPGWCSPERMRCTSTITTMSLQGMK